MWNGFPWEIVSISAGWIERGGYMRAHYTDQSAAALAPAYPEAEEKAGQLLYQAATILVMLLFLVSFWSC